MIKIKLEADILIQYVNKNNISPTVLNQSCLITMPLISWYNITYKKYFDFLINNFDDSWVILSPPPKDEFYNFTKEFNSSEFSNCRYNTRISKINTYSTEIKKIRDILIKSNSFSHNKNKYEKWDDLYFTINWNYYSISQKKYRELLYNYILVCPYCWKIGFIKRDNSYDEESYSFELDHFFQKAIYPEFALNAYNLIPVCKICNQFIKWQREFWIWNHFHPYLWVFHYDWNKFELINKKWFNDVFEFWLDIKNTTDVKGNIIDSKWNILDFKSLWFWNTKAWESKENYQSHLDYLLLDNIYKYSPDTKSDYSMFLNIKDVLLSWWKQTYEIKELFKNWYPKESKDILKFTNWKMKRDLIDRLEKLTPFLPIYLSALNKQK